MKLTANKSTGFNPVRTYGEPMNIVPVILDFSEVTDYSTGGEEIDLDSFFNYDEDFMMVIPPKDGYIFEYDDENDKVIVYEGDGTDGIAEVANEDDIASIGSIPALVFGY